MYYSPVRHSSSEEDSFDLHVLGTPPAFILSQNRTLHKKLHEENQLNDSQNKKIDDRLIRKGASHKNLAAV